ncbi:MAG: hypothetical protein FWC38_02405 [Proteobacteria bacterium]|nr:hypothetical protein [Pseudomonadota bacterium]MCL2307088.1 hypothetical protein [Pseudomonadota bacterium]
MVDINALMGALPATGLRPRWLMSIAVDPLEDGERIYLLEPPAAGPRVAFIHPLEALKILLHYQSATRNEACVLAQEIVVRMKSSIAEDRWVHYLNDGNHEKKSIECVSAPDFLDWLRNELPTEIIDFLEKAADLAARLFLTDDPEKPNEPAWYSECPKKLPSWPYEITEQTEGGPWGHFECQEEMDAAGLYPFAQWREDIYPITEELKTALGKPVYCYMSQGSELIHEQSYDAFDIMHRFLYLHACCVRAPESAYVRYLVKASGALDVEELKAALVNPANYTKPFNFKEVIDRFGCEIDYLSPEVNKTVAVVFTTHKGRWLAESILAQQIDAHVLIIAPKALVTDEWVEQATPYCRSRKIQYIRNGKINPIEALAQVDKLITIGNRYRPSTDGLYLSKAVADLLWLASCLGIYTDYTNDGWLGANLLDRDLEEYAAGERADPTWELRMAEFMSQLKDIRLKNTSGGSDL